MYPHQREKNRLSRYLGLAASDWVAICISGSFEVLRL